MYFEWISTNVNVNTAAPKITDSINSNSFMLGCFFEVVNN